MSDAPNNVIPLFPVKLGEIGIPDGVPEDAVEMVDLLSNDEFEPPAFCRALADFTIASNIRMLQAVFPEPSKREAIRREIVADLRFQAELRQRFVENPPADAAPEEQLRAGYERLYLEMIAVTFEDANGIKGRCPVRQSRPKPWKRGR